MTKEQFEVYISPNYLTFETFKQSIINSPITTLYNFDSIILDKVLSFDNFSPTYNLSGDSVAVLINCPINFPPLRVISPNPIYDFYVNSRSLATGAYINPRNTYPGAIFVSRIRPPVLVSPTDPNYNECYTFLIFRFN